MPFLRPRKTYVWLAVAALSACKDEPPPPAPVGELMLAIQTDMSLPKDVDTVRIEVSSYGSLQFGNDYAVGPGGLKIPATIAIVEGKDDATPVMIRVIARQGQTARMLREVVTTVPSERIAMLRVPIQWLCDGSATTSAGGEVAAACGEGQTCIAGTCTSVDVDSSALPAWSAADLFGGGSGTGDGTCFDVSGCFAQSAPAELDLATCTAPLPAGGAGVNVAVELPEGGAGICAGGRCLVPLDRDAETGWSEQGGSIRLPAAVCARVSSAAALGVAVATRCETKTPAVPTCGPWSSVTGQPGGGQGGSGAGGSGKGGEGVGASGAGGAGGTGSTSTAGAGGTGSTSTTGAGGTGSGASGTGASGASGAAGAGGAAAVGPALAFLERYGDTASQRAQAIAMDASDNTFVVGSYQGLIDPAQPAAASGFEIFLAKLDATGALVWMKTFADTSYTHDFLGVAVDTSGAVWITGGFQGTIDFGGGPFTSATSKDGFLARFDSAGNHLFSISLGPDVDTGYALAAAPDGGVVFNGGLFGTIDLGLASGPITTAAGTLIAKFAQSGTAEWAAVLQGGNQAMGEFLQGERIAVDSFGNTWVTGWFQGTGDLGGGPVTANQIDTFLVKLDASGANVLRTVLGDVGGQYGTSLAADGSGNILFAGENSGTIDLGGGPLVSPPGGNAFIAKLGGGAEHVWSKSLGTGLTTIRVGADALGYVLLAGNFEAGIDLGGGPMQLGSGATYVGRLDPAGNYLWGEGYATASGSMVQFVDAAPSGLFTFAGGFKGQLALPGGPTVGAAGLDDAFVLGFAP